MINDLVITYELKIINNNRFNSCIPNLDKYLSYYYIIINEFFS
jgi:hypothetical protein